MHIDWTEVRYANCWEDGGVLADALAPVRGARVLSIASAGDNAFTLLAHGAASVLAVDVSPAQLALCELKVAALRRLDHDALLAFLGALTPPRPDGWRLLTYATLARELSSSARAFWDARPDAIRAGVLHAGRLERYFQLFRRLVLPLVHDAETCAAALQPRDAAARARFHARRWDNWRWRLAFRLFFSRVVLGRIGRDPAMLLHAEGAVAERILARTRRGFVDVAPHTNPYLTYVLTGSFAGCLPDWLRPENHAALRARLSSLELRRCDLRDVLVPGAGFDAFNLSDLPEYLAPAEFEDLLRRVHASAAPGARVAYWNLLVPRRRPATLRDLLATRDAARLHERARAFFYEDLVLEVAR